jgi:hypothetical protein
VFTVSVGNIPPGATVLIKITYVAELPVEYENIVFSLPGSLAPWSCDQALKDRTQVMPCYLLNASNVEQHKVIDNSHYRLILKLGKEMRINHHS